MKCGIFALTVLLATGPIFASYADVLVGDAVLGPHPFEPSGHQLALTQSTAEGGLFAVWITGHGGGNYDFTAAGIAEEYGLYAALPGLKFDPAHADAQTPLVSNNGVDPGSSLQSFLMGETKYFAYWDERNETPRGQPDRLDNYGWLTLTHTPAGLVLNESVTAIGGGIIVGTTTQIPEPLTAVLLVGGFMVICMNRRQMDGGRYRT